jgi:hypothetical protein
LEAEMLFHKAMKGSIAILLVSVVEITVSAKPFFCCTPTANMTEHYCCPEAPTHPNPCAAGQFRSQPCLEPTCSAPQSLVGQPSIGLEKVRHIDLGYPTSAFEADSNSSGTDLSKRVALVHLDKLFLRIHVLLI